MCHLPVTTSAFYQTISKPYLAAIYCSVREQQANVHITVALRHALRTS